MVTRVAFCGALLTFAALVLDSRHPLSVGSAALLVTAGRAWGSGTVRAAAGRILQIRNSMGRKVWTAGRRGDGRQAREQLSSMLHFVAPWLITFRFGANSSDFGPTHCPPVAFRRVHACVRWERPRTRRPRDRQGPMPSRMNRFLNLESCASANAEGSPASRRWGASACLTGRSTSTGRRVQRGDKAAFDLLVSKYQRKIFRLLSRLIRDPGRGRRRCPGGLHQGLPRAAELSGDSAFYTWLYRIAINTAKNYLVSQGRRAPTTTETDIEDAETFDDGEHLRDLNTPEADAADPGKLPTPSIGRSSVLPEDLRTAVVLRELEGLSYEEIAETMNCPIGTVRSRIFRAREAIAEELRPVLNTTKDQRW